MASKKNKICGIYGNEMPDVSRLDYLAFRRFLPYRFKSENKLKISKFEHTFGNISFMISQYLNANDFRKMYSISKKIKRDISLYKIQQMREKYALKKLDKFAVKRSDVLSVLHVTVKGIHDMSEFMPYVLEFKNLQELVITEYVDNKSRITGSIPDDIGLLHNLKTLIIKGHMVSTIPKSMICMNNLKYLILWDNVILGKIPDEFFNPENNILKNPRSVIKIWKRALGGRLVYHTGSIMNYKQKYNESVWFVDTDVDLNDFNSYSRMPLLVRSNAISYQLSNYKLIQLKTTFTIIFGNSH